MYMDGGMEGVGKTKVDEGDDRWSWSCGGGQYGELRNHVRIGGWQKVPTTSTN